MAESIPNNPQENNDFMVNEEQAQANNPFIREEAGEKIKGREAPLKKPVFMEKPEKKEEIKEKEPPLKFKGSFGGGEIRKKFFSFAMGRKTGRKDFKAFGGKKDVREGMKELRDRFASTGGNFIRRNKTQIEANRLRRQLPYLRGDEHTAATKFLKELEEKTGIKPKI